MEVAAFVISILAFSSSILGYFVHDRKLKNQEAKLNDYQLQKIDDEKLELCKANVQAILLKDVRTFKVYNKGKAVARNIQLFTNNGWEAHLLNNPFPLSFLNSQDHIDIRFATSKESPEQVELTLSWDDERGKNNTFQKILIL